VAVPLFARGLVAQTHDVTDYDQGSEELAIRIVVFGTGDAGGYFGAQVMRAPGLMSFSVHVATI
jgi:hypothetical protein